MVDWKIHYDPLLSRLPIKGGYFWSRTGKDFPKGRHATLTDKILGEHFAGKRAIGLCPIKPGESVTEVALLDMDDHDKSLAPGEMIKLAQAVCKQLDADDLVPHLFTSSGGAGAHIVILFERPQDAYSVRMAVRESIAKLGYKDGTGVGAGDQRIGGVQANMIECFPKQNHVPLNGHGSMFILVGAGKSEPFDWQTGASVDPADIDWVTSPDVLYREMPAQSKSDEPERSLIDLVSVLEHIDPEPMGYDTGYYKVIAAIHQVSRGSEEGYEIAEAWSRRGSRHRDGYMRDRIWQYCALDRDGGYLGFNYLKSLAVDWLDPMVRAQFPPLDDDEAPIDDEKAQELHTKNGRNVRSLIGLSTNKQGKILATLAAVAKGLTIPDLVGCEVAHDAFLDELVIRRDDGKGWRPIGDGDFHKLRVALAKKNFEQPSVETMRGALAIVADDTIIDTARDLIVGLEWDGVPRIERFFHEYLKTEDTPYARALGLYMFTAIAGRVMDPGCQVDMVPVLVGDQGLRKSSAIAALSPKGWYSTVNLSDKDADFGRALRGLVIGELDELKGLGTKDAESIKSMITRRFETWIPKFKELKTKYQRRAFLIGTTNNHELLSDTTGERRWLPIVVEEMIDADEIALDRYQLLAEGRVLWEKHGVLWEDAQRLAAAEHHKFKVSDPWEGPTADWLAGMAPDRGEWFTMAEALGEAAMVPREHQDGRQHRRMAAVLRGLGCKSQTRRRNGVKTRGWLKPEAEE